MKYVPFGKLGFEVSRYGLGCMRLPLELQPDGSTSTEAIDEKHAIAMIRHAADSGVNYFDTAHGYHGGNSKIVLGKALSDGYRERVLVASKLPPWNVKTADDFERILDEHLVALRTDHIDFWLLHSMNRESWEKLLNLGILEHLDAMVAKGKIRFPAFSFHDDLDVFKEILDAYDWKMCQIQYNLLDIDHQAGRAGLKYAAGKGVPVVVMEPLKGGRLAGNVPQYVLDRWATAQTQRSPQEWAFRWLADQPEVTVVLSGASNMDQLKDSLEIFQTAEVDALSDAERRLVDEVRRLYQSRTRVDCTACDYCLPCPAGVAIPRIFALINEGSMYENWAEVQKRYAKLVDEGNGAKQCVACGNCEAVCPQSLEIIKDLKMAHQALVP
ncbi:MAG: aldo/keto reductase [Bacillota bacterium]|nr:aldo/keto reductase [Bacillota bacterium]